MVINRDDVIREIDHAIYGSNYSKDSIESTRNELDAIGSKGPIDGEWNIYSCRPFIGWMIVLVNQGCAAFRELVDDGINGIFATREDLEEEIISLLKNEDRELMAKSGAEKARTYSWSAVGRSIEMLCDEVQQSAR